eukprot:TRINITY_DN18870_c0_g1_i1.p1 TRINITY_DN18870_c0_g1~~TRINITY_DN18870_c0_g1_i1.p1  ORF type:complete len:500 (+),score=42.37 TRINITY_DN18870_c0_g1_i1:96-1502(+)
MHVCPICRRQPASAACGVQAYLESECPVCLEVKSPFVLLPCGHGMCENDFHNCGWTLKTQDRVSGEFDFDACLRQVYLHIVSLITVLMQHLQSLSVIFVHNRALPRQLSASSSSGHPRASPPATLPMAMYIHDKSRHVFWIGSDARLHEFHIGVHNCWKWQYGNHGAPGASASLQRGVVAGRNSNSHGVFWQGVDGKVHEMHQGDYNGWGWQYAEHHAPALNLNAHMCIIYHEDAKNLFWIGSDSKLHELHQGKHNGWRWQYAQHDAPCLLPGSSLVAARNDNSMGVFWGGRDGRLHEMHQGHYNGWRWGYSAHHAPGLQPNQPLSLLYHADAKNIFWAGPGEAIQVLHQGKHNSWQWQHYAHRAPGLLRDSSLVAARNDDSMHVFWGGAGDTLHEMHQGCHTGWCWRYSQHKVPGLLVNKIMGFLANKWGKHLFYMGSDSNLHEFHQGVHNKWIWQRSEHRSAALLS